MAKYRNYKNKLEMFLASSKGRRFLNIAYSWGAAVVILGALFKLLHWPFGNQMLFIGMMTEFLVFFISGLEKPEEQYKWEQVYPELLSYNPLDKTEIEERRKYLARKAKEARERLYQDEEKGFSQEKEFPKEKRERDASFAYSENKNETIVPTHLSNVNGLAVALPEDEVERLSSSLQRLQEAIDRLTQLGDTTASTMESCQDLIANQEKISKETASYHNSLNTLNRTTEALSQVYESQLKDITEQVRSIEEINGRLDAIRFAYKESQLDSDLFRHENAQMLHRIKELNAVYARLLEAMTINIPAPSYGSYRDRDYMPQRERANNLPHDRYAEGRYPDAGRRASEREGERYPR